MAAAETATAAAAVDVAAAAVGSGSGAAAAASEAANGREARNLAEKQRRDKLNASIQELATMVPHAAESSRRLDKTAVLRFAAHGLRLQYVFGKSATRRRRILCLKGVSSQESSGGSPAAAGTQNPSLHLTDTLMQLLDSCFITITCNGQIVLVSSSVEQLLGHCQSDLYGQNLLQITHPDDQALLRQQLIPRDIETLFYQQRQTTHSQKRQPQQQHRSTSTSVSVSDSDVEEDADEEADPENEDMPADDQDDCEELYPRRSPSPRTIAHLAAIDERLRSDRRCFTIRVARASTRAEATRQYELVKIDGCFRRSDSSLTGGAAANYPIVSQLIRRSRNNNMLAAAAAAAAAAAEATAAAAAAAITGCLPQHDAIAQAALHGISGNDIVLVAMARVLREDRVRAESPECEDFGSSLLYRQPEPYQLEYRTRHLIDGSIIDCDQRIGLVAGYMKDEVRNLSPFCFMHLDDVRWVIVALRQMYDCNSDYGESCYRLLSRNGRFIYLHTKGFLEIDRGSNKVHSFLCVNTLLDEEAGRQKVQEMKNKFSTIIKADVPTQSSSPDLPASQAPQQLERIVLYLIENLQKSVESESGGGQPMDTSMLDDGYSSPASSSATMLTLEEMAPSPTQSQSQNQLALVPPAPSSVKNSISKSVSVVNVTAARKFLYQREQQEQLQREQSATGVIRQLSSCLSETETSSMLSPASSVSGDIPDTPDPNSNTPPPPHLHLQSHTHPQNQSQSQSQSAVQARPSVLHKSPATPTTTQLRAALTSALQ
ncbi:circadian locomoter output cycles protein kaput [Drosophila pseudoobscura]|uniref:Circadian locomoter output cycles protein kaput n=1 Tax=Drosophila pseudoobscura pseudoobscura TaxID=46245 RepID=A0A6I8UHL5_DROPS|nr:circadian locomoter output cycles protein kaput [Drosophila pseudoobscura]